MEIAGTVLNHADGRPLAGVLVSDGRHITRTEADGRFFLPGWEKMSAVFVMLLTNEHDDWYIHTENHTGDYIFKIDPADTAAENFSFLHISDTEIEDKECVFLPVLQKAVCEHRPAFLMHTGDLCREDGVARHCRLVNSQTLGCPVRYTIGNHDFLPGPYGEYRYERLYGPIWYSFDCGRIHFVASPISRGDFSSGYEEKDFWNWLDKDLKMMKPGQKIILFNHTHCSDAVDFRPAVGGRTFDLRAAGLIAWIFGHYHIHCVNDCGGILNICTAEPASGGIDSSPAGVRKISLYGEEISSALLFSATTWNPDPCIWETALPGHIQFSAPVAVGNDVIVCTNDEGYPKKCGIFCLAAECGDLKWSFRTKDGFKGNAALLGGRLYAQDSVGRLYCLCAQTGKLLWQTQTALKPIGDSRMGVVAAEGRVFAGCPGSIQAFDAKTGRLLWKGEELRGENSPAKPVYDQENRQLIVSAHWKCLYAIEIETGRTRWKTPAGNESGLTSPVWFRTATPLLYGGRIYSGGERNIFILNAADGAVVLQKKMEYCMDVSAQPVIDQGVLYMATADHGVLALDPETLDILRQFPVGISGLHTPPYLEQEIRTVESTLQISGDSLIFAASDGGVYFYHKNTAALQKKIQLGAPALTAPIIKNDSVIAADFYAAIRKYRI